MVRQNRISIMIVLTSALLIVGCAPAQYMPQFDDSTLRAKQREISNQTERVPHTISEDPSSVLSRIYNRLEPRARELCITNGEKWLDSSCSNWRVQVLDDENFNAYATPNHEIVFTTEVFRYTKSDDELAFILAHEMGHHILNHAMEDAVNAEIIGATTGLLSGILMGAIASGLGASESTVNDVIEDAIEDGYESGRESGRLTYSIDQESEADKLALQLIELADYSQAEARDIMLFIGADSNDLRSKHNASHPSGAERLAAFDLYASLSMIKPYRQDFSYTRGVSVAGVSNDRIMREPLQELADMSVSAKDAVYEISELGISVQDYIGSHMVAHVSEGGWSALMQSREGVIVVGVEAGGRASSLTIKKGHRIVSAWIKGSKVAVPIKDSKALKIIAEGKEPKYFKNFHVVKTENGFAEWAKLKLLFMP